LSGFQRILKSGTSSAFPLSPYRYTLIEEMAKAAPLLSGFQRILKSGIKISIKIKIGKCILHFPIFSLSFSR